MGNKHLLICDLDNTLYDWVNYFVPSFYAMVDTAVTIMQCDKETLLDDLRAVHQKHHDSEHPFSLLETQTVKNRYRGKPLGAVARALDPAFHAFNSSRKKRLHLHDGVEETLDLLVNSGISIVAYTDSSLFGAVDRLSRLDLFRFFTRVYCRERTSSVHPNADMANFWLEKYPMDKVREISHDQMKPNPAVLLNICAHEGASNADAAYIGDSLSKDVLMANQANIFSIWAKYGGQHDTCLYNALVRISHWTPEEVARERRLKVEGEAAAPDYVARTSFRNVIEAVEFSPRRLARRPDFHTA